MRDRIKDFRRVPARLIEGAPWNWRTHGERQRRAVRASLDELGIIDALKVRELPDGRYQLWDGHLRDEEIRQVGPETLVPILVTDLDEQEAKKANAIFDPITELAGVDVEKLDALRGEIELGSRALDDLLQTVASDAGGAWSPEPADTSPQLPTMQFKIVLDCDDESQQTELLERFNKEGLTCRALIT